MNANVRTSQVLPVAIPGCSSTSTDNSDKATPPALSCIERKYSWIIVAASFWNQFVAHGIAQSLGLYNVEFLEAFGDSKSTTAWITSVAGACIYGLGPIGAMTMNRTSARFTACLGGIISTLGLLISLFAGSVIHLSITFGVIMGSGLCVMFLSSTVIVGQHFQRRRAFATAMSSCGGSLGSLLLPLITSYTIEEYTWRGSLFILAAMCFQTVVFSSLLRPAATITVTIGESETVQKKDSITVHVTETSGMSQRVQMYQESGKDRDGKNSASCSHNPPAVIGESIDVKDCNSIQSKSRGLMIALKKRIVHNPLNNWGFMLYCINGLLCGIGITSVFIILPDFIYITLGSKEKSAFMLMCLATGRIGGAIFASLLGNWKPSHCLHMRCLSLTLVGIAVFLYTCSANTYVFGVISCLIGIGFGSMVALVMQVTVTLVGTSKLAEAMGYVLATTGLGRLIGPPLGGVLFDLSGDYRASFWFTSGVMIASGVLVVIHILIQRRGKRYDVNNYQR